jgi:hypothetical protein
MDESPDHEPTLVERGIGVHFNHPLAAQRGIPIRDPIDGACGNLTLRLEQDGELAPIASNGPRLRGSMHGYTSWGAPNARGTSCARVTEAGCNIADAG